LLTASEKNCRSGHNEETSANVKVFQQSQFTLGARHSTGVMSDDSYKTLRLHSNWRGRLLFARQGVAERLLDWALPALWILSLVVTVVSFW
jgi:hypothetical protein